MSQNLLVNETHFSGFKGKLKAGTKLPVDGDEIENIKAGSMFYNSTDEIIYIYYGGAWYGKAATAS